MAVSKGTVVWAKLMGYPWWPAAFESECDGKTWVKFLASEQRAAAKVQPATAATFAKFIKEGRARSGFLDALKEMKKRLPAKLASHIDAALGELTSTKRKGGNVSGKRKSLVKSASDPAHSSKVVATATAATAVVSPKRTARQASKTKSPSPQKHVASPTPFVSARGRGRLRSTDVEEAKASSPRTGRSIARTTPAGTSTSPQLRGAKLSGKPATTVPKVSQQKRRACPEPDCPPAKRAALSPPAKHTVALPSADNSVEVESLKQAPAQGQAGVEKGTAVSKKSKGGRRDAAKSKVVTDQDTNQTEEVDDGYLALQSPLAVSPTLSVVTSQRPFWVEQYTTVEPNRYGFIGMGIMGHEMAKNLLACGNHLTIWNRTREKCAVLEKLGAKVASTISEVIAASNITFTCVSTPQASREVFFGPNGVLDGLVPGKGYIDMSTVDPETATEIAEATSRKGAQFLEAPVCGSKKPAQNGQLVILAAGSSSLFHLASPAFDILGKKTSFLGAVGSGSKLKLIIDLMMGTVTAAFCEGMALARKAGVSQSTVLDILDHGSMSSLLFQGKGIAILKGQYPASFPLKHQQKDLRLALELSKEVGQRVPVSEAANQHYVDALKMNLENSDMAAVYKAVVHP